MLAFGSSRVAQWVNGSWIDVFTDRGISSFSPDKTIIPIDLPYNPIVITAVGGYLVVELVDKNWPVQIYVHGSGETSPILNYKEIIYSGRRSPQTMIRQLDQLIARSQNWNDLISEYPFEATLYFGSQAESGICPFGYLGSDSRYYNAQDGQLSQLEYQELTVIVVTGTDFNLDSLYSLEEAEADIIVKIDRWGGIYSTERVGAPSTIINRYPIRIPRSLIVSDGMVETSDPLINMIFEHRLDILKEYDTNFDQYLDLLQKDRWYLHWSENPEVRTEGPFQYVESSSGGTFTDYLDNVIFEPQGLIKEIFIGESSEWLATAIYQLSTGLSVSVGLDHDGEIQELDRIRTANYVPTSLDPRIIRVYSLTTERDPDFVLLSEIQRRIRLGLGDENLSTQEVGSNSEKHVTQQVLEELIIRMYGHNFTIEPETLDGYSRMPYSQFIDLYDRGLITQIETPDLLQPFAGLPGTYNRIITFISSGSKFFTKVRPY